MQTSTVRDVAMTPPKCPTTEAGQVGPNGPIPYFQKQFFHNGYIKSLKQLVHFYNTRDAFPIGFGRPVTSGNCPPGTVEKVTCWPQPEVSNNEDMTVGNLQLTDAEENLLVIALQDMTDGFDPANPTVPGILYKNIDTFTGQCTIAPPVLRHRPKVMRPSSLPGVWLNFLAQRMSAVSRRCPRCRSHRTETSMGAACDPHTSAVASPRENSNWGLFDE
jgi:hypothetical protein